MRIYQASLHLRMLIKYHELYPQKKLNVLRSFALPSSEILPFLVTHRDKSDSIILDSGAYTLNYAKADVSKMVNLSGYSRYLESFGHYYNFYFCLDSDFNEDGFETNQSYQKKLEQAGHKPVPVIHNIYDSEIEFYIDAGYTRIALGSSQINSLDDLYHAMAKFVGTKVKVHLFGSTTFNYLSKFPIHSADSASWANTGKYGSINYWNPEKEGSNKVDHIYVDDYLKPNNKNKVTLSNYEYRQDLKVFLGQELGVTFDDLLGYDGAYYKQLVNTHFYVQLEEIVTRIHQEKGFDTIEKF